MAQNPFYGGMDQSFLSPLSSLTTLDSDLFSKMKSSLEYARNYSHSRFGNQFEKNKDHDLNVEGIYDPYYGHHGKEIDIDGNYYTVGMSGIIPRLTDEQRFHFLLAQMEDRKRIYSVYREINTRRRFESMN